MSVCVYICQYECNTLPSVPSPHPHFPTTSERQRYKETKRQRDRETKRQRDRETERVARPINYFLYQASIMSSRWLISFIIYAKYVNCIIEYILNRIYHPKFSRIWDWFSIKRILFQYFLLQNHPFIA